jgi:hypothetical protein
MSLVAFSFGAFGDVLALAELISTVVRTLSGTCGASIAYQSLLLEMTVLRDSLLHIDRLTSTHGSAGGLETGRNLRHMSSADLQGLVSACKISMINIEDKIQYYQHRLKKGTPGRRWMESWRKIGWSLFKVCLFVCCSSRAAVKIHLDRSTKSRSTEKRFVDISASSIPS